MKLTFKELEHIVRGTLREGNKPPSVNESFAEFLSEGPEEQQALADLHADAADGAKVKAKAIWVHIHLNQLRAVWMRLHATTILLHQ